MELHYGKLQRLGVRHCTGARTPVGTIVSAAAKISYLGTVLTEEGRGVLRCVVFSPPAFYEDSMSSAYKTSILVADLAPEH